MKKIVIITILVIVVVFVGHYYKNREISYSKIEDTRSVNCTRTKYRRNSNPSKIDSTTHYFKLINPIAGETFHVGDTMIIRWKDCNEYDSKLHITLYDNRYDGYIGSSGEIASDVPSKQEFYEFKIPKSLGNITGGKINGTNVYSVGITTGMQGVYGTGDTSGEFTILP